MGSKNALKACVAVGVVLAAASAWATEGASKAKKIEWPDSFVASPGSVEEVMSLDNGTCYEGKSSGNHYLFVDMDAPAKFSIKSAADRATSHYDFQELSISKTEANLTRGKKLASWYRFNIDKLYTETVLRSADGKVQMFFQVKTTGGVETNGQWKKVCQEAFDIASAGNRDAN